MVTVIVGRKYAACVMCKNEEANVPLWLERTRDFDYRVVLDTGSTDATIDLFLNAQVDNITFLRKEFNPFKFDEVRNYVKQMVPHDTDWIFYPDMDEEYQAGWRQEMENILSLSPDATRILHKSIHYDHGVGDVGSESGSSIDSKIFKRGHYRWVKPIHEYPEYMSSNDEIIVTTERIVRHHYHVNRLEVEELCYHIARLAVEDDPTDSWCIWFALRDAYKRGNVDDTIFYGEMYLENTRPYTDFRSLAHMFIGQALKRKFGGPNIKARLSFLRSCAENPNNKRAWELYNDDDRKK